MSARKWFALEGILAGILCAVYIGLYVGSSIRFSFRPPFYLLFAVGALAVLSTGHFFYRSQTPGMSGPILGNLSFLGAITALACIPISVLTYPSVKMVNDAKAQGALSDRMQEVGRAIHTYHDTHRHFPPPAICGKDGKPLLSWRVALLPHLAHGDLYRQFKLDEPWDSAHNFPLAAQMPAVYALPTYLDEGAGSDKTYFQAYVGPGTVFEPNRVIRLGHDIPDGTSSTVLFVLAPSSVVWTKPEDLPFTPERPVLRPRCGAYPGYAVVFGDGRVELIDTAITDNELRGIITRNGGEPPLRR